MMIMIRIFQKSQHKHIYVCLWNRQMNLIIISCFKNIPSTRGLYLFMLSKMKTKIRKVETKKFSPLASWRNMSSVGTREHSFILVCNLSSVALKALKSSTKLFPPFFASKKTPTSTTLYNLISISSRNSHLKFLPLTEWVEPVSGVLGKSLSAAPSSQQVSVSVQFFRRGGEGRPGWQANAF